MSTQDPNQPPLEGLENVTRQPGRGSVRYWRDRLARAERSVADEPSAALWQEEEIPSTPTAERPCADRAWPIHRALHLVGLGQIVLSASPYTDEADLADTWCRLRQNRRRHDTTGGWFGPADERGVRELVRAGLVAVGRRMIRVRSGRHWYSARRLELTPAGHALWRRWTHLVDPQLQREAELAASLAAWRASHQ